MFRADKEYDLPAIPRVGEMVCTDNGQRYVRSVSWFIDDKNEPVVQLHLETLEPDEGETVGDVVVALRAAGWKVSSS